MTDPLDELLEESRQLGYLGPGPTGPHRDHALAFAEVLPEPPARALDLGAGGGLPGLVLAAVTWPATTWVFLDAQDRRTAFLEHAVQRLGLADRVEVRTERAEVAGRAAGLRASFDLVVARSFGSPGVTAECAAPFLRVGGHLVVSEPPGSEGSRWPIDGLAEVGLADPEVLEVAGAHAEAPTSVRLVRLRQAACCGDRYPRRTGIPAKRPLF